MKTIKFIIPNLITSFNLIFGLAAIVSAFSGDTQLAFWLIITAAICDFADGFAARILKAYSDFGKQLDSLSDLISFGVAPAVLVFMFLKNSPDVGLPDWFAYNAFSLVLFSAYRLARFNIMPPSNDFKGLAVPANALYFAGLICFADVLPKAISEMFLSVSAIHIQIVFMNLLMISPVSMFSMKFKNFKFRENVIRYLFLFCSVVLLLICRIHAIWFIMVFYIILSLAVAVFSFKKVEL
jgi:CDP-diacylglycerol---serine O-phosphatidyltransferase